MAGKVNQMAKRNGAALEALGIEDVIRKLDEVHPRLAKRVLKKSTLRGARLLVKRMKELAPVRTGKLRRSIAQKAYGRRADVLNRIVGPRWPDGAAVNFLEYGTGARRVAAGVKPSGSGTKVAGITPRRFVLNTWLQKGKAARALISEDTLKFSLEELEKLGRE